LKKILLVALLTLTALAFIVSENEIIHLAEVQAMEDPGTKPGG
jgi:hypothetical protein